MTKDIEGLVERLDGACNCNIETSPCSAEDDCRTAIEAATALRSLKEERDRYREALVDIGHEPTEKDEFGNYYDDAPAYELRQFARQALEQSK